MILPTFLVLRARNSRLNRPWKITWLGLIWLTANVPSLMAQDVLTSPPPTPATPSVVQAYQNSNPMQVFAPLETVLTPPFQWGPIIAHPHVNYQFLYGNGIQSSPGSHHNTIVQTVSPGMLLNLGAHWTLDYTPTLRFYSSSNFQNNVNHSLRLGWGTAYRDWFFSGSQSFVFSSDPNVETAAQTDRQHYSTALNAAYQFNDKMSLDLEVNQNLNYVNSNGATNYYQQNLANSQSWSTMDWLNYQFWPRLNVGVGPGFGYTQQQNSPDSVFEQFQGRVNWRATDKISFQLSGGAYGLQYLSGGAGNLLTPIFAGTIQYQPFEHTRLSLNASRTVSASSFENQTTESTGINANLNQRLLGKLYLNLSGGYARTRYLASVYGLSTSRSDDHYTFNARLSCPFLKRGTFAVTYLYSDNSSSQNGFANGSSAFGYTSSQVGFEIGYRY